MSKRSASDKRPSAEEIADIRYQMLDGTWHRKATNAQTQIFQLETLKEMLHLRIECLNDGHAVALIQLVGNVLHDLRRELYGEDMGP
ncbi:hypothetical protein [Hyphomicrobium sp. CS1BSMeth3]|uniref:hypothetical protein n=1 Tax=Hyphomicrobium sp. CS1BSMeth3 TaxID=1892844 RepID=UPI0009304453|nr:hypothetical protein [Hyphomicrobium sp. CS1BSMeth3]